MFVEIPRNIKIESVNTAFLRKEDSVFYFAGESHPFWEMVYVFEGSVGITADERVYTLSEGDMVFHKPMEFHRIWSQKGTSLTFCVISFEAEGEGLKKIENTAVKCSEDMKELINRMVDIKDKAFSMRDECQLKGILDKTAAFEYLLMLEMLLCKAGEKGERIDVAKFRDASIFSRAVSVLNENISTKMTVEQLAVICFVSTSKIKKVFAKYAGCGVAEYFNFMKVARARAMLKNGEPISAISDKLGFSNQFYFSSVFKKIMSMTPTQYKKVTMQH